VGNKRARTGGELRIRISEVITTPPRDALDDNVPPELAARQDAVRGAHHETGPNVPITHHAPQQPSVLHLTGYAGARQTLLLLCAAL
jgi:hypothetical protein